MKELHQVTAEELPILSQWLKGHLPESWRLFGLTREMLNGRWQGHVFYTLGWPDIRAVVEDFDEANHPCPTFWKHVRFKSLYAPKSEDTEIILHHHIDWTKPVTFLGVTKTCVSLLHELAKEKDLEYCLDLEFYLMQARPGDIEARSIPEGFKIRPIDPKTDAEYCASTWFLKTPATIDYVKSLVARLPNACLANSDNQCVSFEIGTDYGTIGMLFTHESYRRRGLGIVLVSNLVQEYFKDGLPVVTWVDLCNDPSVQLHMSLGFTKVCNLFNIICFPRHFVDKENDFLYKFLQTVV